MIIAVLYAYLVAIKRKPLPLHLEIQRHRGNPIRREKVAMGTVEFEKVTTPEPDQQTILDYLKVRL